MARATRLTNLEVTGTLRVTGNREILTPETIAALRIETSDAQSAAGSTPTQAEFNRVVTLANALKAAFNSLLLQMGEPE